MADAISTLAPANSAAADLAPTDPASGGKREETKRANRSAILDAARSVFAEMGYEAASVRDIIRRTPLSVGAFYNYYRSKEVVYEALAADGARRQQSRRAATAIDQDRSGTADREASLFLCKGPNASMGELSSAFAGRDRQTRLADLGRIGLDRA